MYRMLFVVLAFLLSTSPLHAQTVFERLRVHGNDVRGVVADIVQDSDGFIWIATRRGLFRHDGRDLVPWRAAGGGARALASDDVLRLFPDGKGILWIATAAGGLEMFDHRRGTHRVYSFAPHAVDPGRVESIVIDAAGTVWALTEQGTVHFRSGTDDRFRMLDAPPASALLFLADASPGLLTAEGELLRLNESRGTAEAPAPAALFSQAWWRDIRSSAAWRKRIWLRLLARRSPAPALDSQALAAVRRLENAGILGADTLNDVLYDSRGGLWVAPGSGGLLHVDADGAIGRVELDAADAERELVNRLFEDASGTVWVGSVNGISTASPWRHRFNTSRYLTPEGEMVQDVLSLACDGDGRLWVGTVSQGLLRFGSGTDSERLRGERIAPDSVLSMTPAAEGMLISTADGLLLLATDHGMRLVTEATQVLSLRYDHRGSLWLATPVNGIGELKPGSPAIEWWEPPQRNAETSGAFDATTILEDRAGNLWFGSDGGGLIKLLPDRTTFVRFRSGAGAMASGGDRILALAEGLDGVLWIGTREGLLRIDPASNEMETVDVGGGSADTAVGAIAALPDGSLWLSGMSGLAHYTRRDGVSRQYGVEDGFTILEQTPGATCADGRGVLWFGGPGGVIKVDTAMPRNPHAPPVAITFFATIRDGRENPVPLAGLRELKLAYEENGFQFEYAALDFADPRRNRLAHLLEGIDSGWVSAEGQRGGRYAGLPPGTYTLRLRGANNDGVWNNEGPVIAIEVVAPFWMTWEFRIATLLGVAALVLAGAWIRIRAVERHRSALMREVEERKIAELKLLSQQARLRTLASELTLSEERQRRHFARLVHDDIGHALLGSRVKLSTLEKKLPSEDVRGEMQEIARTLEEALQSARSLTTELSPPSLYQFGLESAVENLVERFGRDHSIRCAVTLLNSAGVSEEVSVLLYQSLRELLINILKHAGAASINVVINADREYICLSVQDDGVGFDARALLESDVGPGGFGLFSIRTRLESVGGRMEIEASPGRGTTVRLYAPVAEEPQENGKS